MVKKVVAKAPAKAKKVVKVEAPAVEVEAPEVEVVSSGKVKNVVIVESPAKAKTINKILGDDFVVKACMGHVRDLPERKFGIDIENNFEPDYQILKARAKTVAELKAATKGATAVYLAPDPDREGEAIAWHLREALNVPKKTKVFRVTFNEITKKAVTEAFEHPGEIVMDRVYAQQARRFLDRIVGYKLSPLLWKKIARGLSAGRVQSVAVKLIVDREKEIRAFKSEEYWRLLAHLLQRPEDAARAPAVVHDGGEGQPEGPKPIVAELKKISDKEADLKNKAQIDELVAALLPQAFRIVKVEKKERSEEPPPPFTTSTLQQQASIRMRYTTKRTMAIAQQLYEGVELGTEGAVGLITYMRTDSVRMSDDAVRDARKYIAENHGMENLSPDTRTYKARKGAQEAHEAIRPTGVERDPESIAPYLSPEQYKLYRMIWRRFVSTQMAASVYVNTDAEIAAGPATFQARGRVLKVPGYTILSGHRLKKDEQILPPLAEGQVLKLKELLPSQHFTQPPPRYTEATLVKALEKNGIGRPSTYAPIISTIQDRGYVRSEDRKLHATDLGIVVTDKLSKFFNDIMDPDFTSQMEEKLDKIEEAKAQWQTVLGDFYALFSKDLAKATAEMESERGITPEGAAPCETRILACSGYPDCKTTKSIHMDQGTVLVIDEKCEKCGSDMVIRQCGKPMVIRWNKLGQFLGCSGYPECKTTRPMNPPEMTEEKCEKCAKPMVVRTGRNGRFLACSGYPDCKTTKSIHMDKGTVLVIDEKCEKCGSDMVIRRGRRGRFLACPKYPDCKFTRPMPKAADVRQAEAVAGVPGAVPAAEEEGEPAEGEEIE